VSVFITSRSRGVTTHRGLGCIKTEAEIKGERGGGGLTGILVGQFVAVRKVGKIAGPLLRICHWRGHQEKGTKNGKSGNLSGPEKICIFKCRWLDFRHF
jgi:hypothetical protein